MKLAFITDEATQDFQEAVALAKRCGLQGLELRSVYDTPIDRIDHETLRKWKAQLDREGLQVCNLAASFYKCEIVGNESKEDGGNFGKPEAEEKDSRRLASEVRERSLTEVMLDEEMEKLSRLCDAADILGCETIRGFAFFAPKDSNVFGEANLGEILSREADFQPGLIPAEKLAPYFERPGKLLRERGKRLLLEADPSVNTTNHAAVAKLLALLDREVFGAIYDPGNDIYDPLGESPFPQGYQAIRPYLGHVHIKDAVLTDGKPYCVNPGTGLVDYPGLLKTLIQDGYQGWLSLEPHYRKDIVLTEEQMRIPQGSDFSRGGREALEESAEALKKLIREGGMLL